MRHLMEPDPDLPDWDVKASITQVCWFVALFLGLLVLLAAHAS